MPRRQANRFPHSVQGHVKDHDYERCVSYRVLRRRDVPEHEPVVRALHDDYLVLRSGIDKYHRGAARAVLDGPHVGNADALPAQMGDHLFAERVVADPPDEAYRYAHARDCDRLVCALAAEASVETVADDRLARPRKSLGLRHKVHIDRADNYDGLFFHRFRSGKDSNDLGGMII